jgi:hypothetical protein
MAFDFFRKYQRPILYTAGIFALVSFSISGALMGFFTAMFERDIEGPKLTLGDGRVVEVTQEDYSIGRMVAQLARTSPVIVLPPLDFGEDGEARMEPYAFLRRIAIESGLEYSMVEVDAAIEQAVSVIGENRTAVDLALSSGFTSLAPYRAVVGEAMRIGNMLRLLSLAGDTSTKSLVQSLLRKRDRELLTLRVASLDKKEIETELKKTKVSDDELQKWLAGLTEAEQSPYRHPNHRVALIAVGFLHDKFDPAQWEEELKGKDYGDQQLRQRYDLDREVRFRRTPPAPPASQPTSQPASQPDSLPASQPDSLPQTQPATQPQDLYEPFEQVQAQLKKLLQAEDAMKAIWAKVQEAMAAHLQEKIDVRNKAAEEHATAQKAHAEAEARLKAGPETEELKKAAADRKTELTAKEEQKKAAETALDDARRAFPMLDKAREFVNNRAGFENVTVAEPKGSDGLKDLGPFGKWENAWMACAIDAEGDLSSQVQSTDKASFHWQVTKVVKRPLKEFAEIKEQLTTDWYGKQADSIAKDKTKTLEDKLLALGKEARKAEIEKLTAEHAKLLEDHVAQWKQQVQARLDRARRNIEKIKDPASKTRQEFEAIARTAEAELAAEAKKREELDKATTTEIEKKVKDEARKAWPDVLEAAAKEAGFQFQTIGPHPRNLSMQPRFHDRYSADVRFLFSMARVGEGENSKQLKDLKAGECSDILDDATNRTLHLAAVVAVAKPDDKSITRRDLMQEQESFLGERLLATLSQSFEMKAIEERYNVQRPKEEKQETMGPEKPPAGKGGTQGGGQSGTQGSGQAGQPGPGQGQGGSPAQPGTPGSGSPQGPGQGGDKEKKEKGEV